MSRRVPVLGIVGGIASGKSTVAHIFRELGAAVIDADRIGHELLQSAPIREELVRRWGVGILAEDGSVDRRKVADLVFDDPNMRAELNALLHPPIRQRMEEEMALIQKQGQHPLLVLDAALLLEGGLRDWCDAVLFVEAEDRVRLERAAQARGWPPAELERRERGQMSLQEKRALADYVIRNDGSLEETRKSVRKLFGRLAQARPRGSRSSATPCAVRLPRSARGKDV